MDFRFKWMQSVGDELAGHEIALTEVRRSLVMHAPPAVGECELFRCDQVLQRSPFRLVQLFVPHVEKLCLDVRKCSLVFAIVIRKRHEDAVEYFFHVSLLDGLV